MVCRFLAGERDGELGGADTADALTFCNPMRKPFVTPRYPTDGLVRYSALHQVN